MNVRRMSRTWQPRPLGARPSTSALRFTSYDWTHRRRFPLWGISVCKILRYFVLVLVTCIFVVNKGNLLCCPGAINWGNRTTPVARRPVIKPVSATQNVKELFSLFYFITGSDCLVCILLFVLASVSYLWASILEFWLSGIRYRYIGITRLGTPMRLY